MFSLGGVGLLASEQGARMTLHCASAPELAVQSGRYYDECKPKPPSRAGQDPALASEL